jgi:putative tryptophan/tyrosine transport system substrate-binding protein
MKRREFVTLIGGAALAWPLPARAQQTGKLPTIGWLGASMPSTETERVARFVQRLHELGWMEGRNIGIEFRWGEGRPARFAEIAAEFVRLKVDVIVTSGTPTVIAAKQATSTVPIVFVSVGDPVNTGLVASLARPGGNVTGLSNQNVDLASKRIELLREVVPRLGRLALLVNVDNTSAMLELREAELAARALGIQTITLETRRSEDFAQSIAGLNGRVDGLYVVFDGLVNTNRIRINTFALAERMPTIHAIRDSVESGGLMSYGPNIPNLYRRAGEFVDKILRGAKPADIPVEQPTKFDLVVNLITAKALGLAIPETFLVRADEVIE